MGTVFSVAYGQQPGLTATDEGVFDPLVASVQLYRGTDQLSYPVIYLGETNTLTLAFDLLGAQRQSLRVHILRCEADWSLSRLLTVEYLKGFSSSPINSFQNSVQARTPYVHYTQQVPWGGLTFTKSGNYLAVVTPAGNPQQVLFVKRFLVVEQSSTLNVQILRSTQTDHLRTHQRLRVVLPVDNRVVRSPTQEVSLTLLQNFRWDQARQHIKPAYVYPDRLEYDLSDAVEFPGGNEFRQIDLRSLQTRSLGVADRDCAIPGPCQVWLRADELRAFQRYYANPELDGNYYLGLGYADEAFGAVEGDYVRVHFRLNMNERFATESVVVVGAFNQWKPDLAHALTYNPQLHAYEGELLLKQGIYNYAYAVVNPRIPKIIDLKRLEGSFFETLNTYTVLVYYRPLGERYDRLLGIAWAQGPQ